MEKWDAIINKSRKPNNTTTIVHQSHLNYLTFEQKSHRKFEEQFKHFLKVKQNFHQNSGTTNHND